MYSKFILHKSCHPPCQTATSAYLCPAQQLPRFILYQVRINHSLCIAYSPFWTSDKHTFHCHLHCMSQFWLCSLVKLAAVPSCLWPLPAPALQSQSVQANKPPSKPCKVSTRYQLTLHTSFLSQTRVNQTAVGRKVLTTSTGQHITVQVQNNWFVGKYLFSFSLILRMKHFGIPNGV